MGISRDGAVKSECLLHPRKLPRRSTIGASAKGHLLPHAPAAKTTSLFSVGPG